VSSACPGAGAFTALAVLRHGRGPRVVVHEKSAWQAHGELSREFLTHPDQRRFSGDCDVGYANRLW